MTNTIAYLDCHSGISGDMFLGAMLDAGFSLEVLKEVLAGLPITGYELKFEAFTDKGIKGSRFDVVLAEQDQPTRHLSDIVSLLQRAQIPQEVRATSLAIFQCLAEAEATVHGTEIETVHFHEVGAIDAIIDIVGAATAVASLKIDQLYASPLPLTTGQIQTAHGVLPVPAPATLEILRRVAAPWRPSPAQGEMVTPTGAAILATLARFETPAIAIEHIGYGFGRKMSPWPNCLRACIGPAQGLIQKIGDEADTDWVTVIETNIDNMAGELLGGLMDRLLGTGALDVSFIPMQMKKNRPATLLSVICQVEDGQRLAELLLRETATLGVRIQQMQRLKAQRTQEQIDTPLGPLLMKVKRLGSHIISATPEYEECQRLAKQHTMPLQEVYKLVQRAIDSAIILEREKMKKDI